LGKTTAETKQHLFKNEPIRKFAASTQTDSSSLYNWQDSLKQRRNILFFATGVITIGSLVLVGNPIAFALGFPPMLNCGPVKQSAVEENIESINLAQEAHFSEKKSFANDFNKLGIRLQKQGNDYEYSTRATSSAAFSYGISQSKGSNSYVGAVFVVPATGVKSKAAATREMTTVTILCQANAPGAIKPVEPAYQNGEVACGSNTTEIYRYSP
jgi:hypothetical protein